MRMFLILTLALFFLTGGCTPAPSESSAPSDTPVPAVEPSAQNETAAPAAQTAVPAAQTAAPAAQTAVPAAQTAVPAAQTAVPAELPPLDEKYRPSIYAALPDDLYGPDAQVYDAASKTHYLSVPNFLDDPNSLLPKTSSFIVQVNADGTVEKLYEFPIFEGEVKIGAMGIDFGPDGNLYVCDNQYFFDTNYKSRVWRLPMKEGKPAGDIQLVVSGLKVANAILWDGDKVFVTDTILDEPGKYGSGGIYCFTSEEMLAAGTDEAHPVIAVKPFADGQRDERLIIVEDSENVRGNNCGADGICRDAAGVYYFGNYGDGGFYRFKFGEDGTPTVEKIHKAGALMKCVDGICFDAQRNRVYITDSAQNAIWTFESKPWGEPISFERLWENGDTDGADGSLDLPCECRVVEGKLIISNQDIGVGPTGKCQATDKPYTLSAIELN